VCVKLKFLISRKWFEEIDIMMTTQLISFAIVYCIVRHFRYFKLLYYNIITSDISSIYCEFFDKNKIETIFESRRMLKKKRQDLADQANKLRGGFSKIDDTRVKVKEMAAELEVTQQQVHKSTRECEEFLVTIGTRRTRQ